MPRKQPAAKTEPSIVAYYDRQRRTCLQVARVNGVVKFIPLDVGLGLQVRELPAPEFDRRYQSMVNYPVEKACQLYLRYSQDIGATEDALGYLGQIINISKQEFEMAIKKQQATVAEKPTKTKVAEKPTKTKVAEKPAKAKVVEKSAKAKVVEKSAKAKVVEKPAKAKAAKPDERKSSAAQMFQDLIMQGKLTDDQIFDVVQAEFGLDEKKRGYVRWYRNHLKKQGVNPPEPKATK